MALRRRAWLALAGASALGGACASLTPGEREALAMEPALPPRVLLEHPPFFAQLDFQCGPAALATALGASGVHVLPQALTEAVFLPSRQGSLQLEMLAGARRHGRVACRVAPSLALLLREVAAGEPVVLLQNLGLGWLPLWHYAVVVGYDLPAGEVLLRSGSSRLLALSLATFDRTWARSGRWGFMALAPGRLPHGASQADAEQALLGFERAAPPTQAVLAYRGGLQRWPQSQLMGLGLGNTLHAQGQPAEAAAAFEQVVQRHPQSAPGWINLALTLQGLGRLAPAREAALQAVRVAAWPANAAWQADARAVLATLEGAAGNGGEGVGDGIGGGDVPGAARPSRR